MSKKIKKEEPRRTTGLTVCFDGRSGRYFVVRGKKREPLKVRRINGFFTYKDKFIEQRAVNDGVLSS